MEIALLVIAIIISLLSLLVSAMLLWKRKEGGAGVSPETEAEIRRIRADTESALKLAEYCARTTDNLNRVTEQRLGAIQSRLTEDIKYIVDANARNLEGIRRTVDEKLSSSIDGKLTQSYAQISERLEKMYESVGEMKTLSEGVSDIRRVFSNVKLRGTWGEVQLAALLEQMLAPEQYAAGVKLNPLLDTMVDFAILLPDRNGETVYLPVDSKFPVEEFERLCAASDRGDREGTEKARKNLERAVKIQADSIAKKYILPPRTTDFAVMYLPLEGLYAEVVKAEGLAAYLHQKRVMVSGPTNFGALLSTLQTGFRTAAIQKRSGELIQTLEGFRLEFSKFSELLDKTGKKLKEAQDAIEGASKRTDAIGRKLNSFRGLTSLPPDEEE